MVTKKAPNDNIEKLRVLSDELVKYGNESIVKHKSTLEKIKKLITKIQNLDEVRRVINYERIIINKNN